MGRQNDGDSTMYNSSIALLQERFRELQRVRERRQEKELLKLVSSESDQRVPSTLHLEQNRLTNLLQPDQMILPNRSPSSSSSSSSNIQDCPVSLGLDSLSRKSEFQAMKVSSSLWPNTGSSSSRGFENSDVDTSLHL